MTPAALLTIALGMAGVALVVSDARAARPDPVRRGLGPLAPPVRRSLLDRALDRWDTRVGSARQRNSLRLLGLSQARHRRRQVVCVSVAAGWAALFGWAQGGPSAALFLGSIAVPAGLLAAESQLHRRANRRRAVLARQVLPLTQTLALAVSAGETAAEALASAAGVAAEPMRRWLLEIDAQIRSGRSLEAALTEVSDALEVPGFSLLADTLVAASERGAPLAATLVAQVRDTRDRHRAEALERAGRSDIAMLVPVVFAVLPAVVVVALYPGSVALSSM